MERLIEKSKSKSRPLIWLHDYINSPSTIENISYLKRRVITLQGRANSDNAVPIFWKVKHIDSKSITPFNRLFIYGSDYYKVEFGKVNCRQGSPVKNRTVYKNFKEMIKNSFVTSLW